MATDTTRAAAALRHLDPACPREEWVKVGMAAKAAGLTLDDFTAWSSTAPSFSSPKDCAQVWRSFREDGGIQAGTLFMMAIQAGWRPASAQGSPSHPPASSPKPAPKPVASEKPKTSPTSLWAKFQPATADHPYVAQKTGIPDGLRLVPDGANLTIAGQNVAGWLVVPAQSRTGELRTLQFIPPPGQGKKLNLAGASFEDGLFLVGSLTDSDRIHVVEGIGQAWACWRATGKAAAVCFGAGRMGTVAGVLRKAHPDKLLVIVPDRGKETQAEKIAKDVQGVWIGLPQDKPANYDANDFALEHGADELAELLTRTHAPPRRFKLLTARELASTPPMKWLVRGVLPREGIGAIYGPTGSGKSFLALDLQGAIACHRGWFDHPTKPVPVLYVALEGESGIRQRSEAWEQQHGELPNSFRFLLAPLDIRLERDRVELVESVRAAGLAGGVLVLDTLNRAAPGLDENDSRDMGQVIDAMKALQAELGGLVLVIHHSGKDQTKGMRGHSSLHAALDCAIEVTRTDDRREWKVAKSKDGEDGKAHPFRLDLVEIGVDEDGEPITSCVVVPEEAAEDVTKRTLPKGGNQRVVWDSLGDLLRNSTRFGMGGAPLTRPCVNLEEAIQAIAPRLTCEDKRKHERARQAFTGLLATGAIEHREGWVWIP